MIVLLDAGPLGMITNPRSSRGESARARADHDASHAPGAGVLGREEGLLPDALAFRRASNPGSPSACVVAALVGVVNHFGFGPFTVFPVSHHSEPFMPADRTCNGGAYTFQIPGALAVQDTVAIPMKVQDAASIRCIYAYVQQDTTDGQSAYLTKISRDDGATWEPLAYMGIAQSLPTAYKKTYDFLVNNEVYGLRATRVCHTPTTASSSSKRSPAVPRSRPSRRHLTARTALVWRLGGSSTSTSAARMRSTCRYSPSIQTTRPSTRL